MVGRRTGSVHMCMAVDHTCPRHADHLWPCGFLLQSGCYIHVITCCGPLCLLACLLLCTGSAIVHAFILADLSEDAHSTAVLVSLVRWHVQTYGGQKNRHCAWQWTIRVHATLITCGLAVFNCSQAVIFMLSYAAVPCACLRACSCTCLLFSCVVDRMCDGLACRGRPVVWLHMAAVVSTSDHHMPWRLPRVWCLL
jgi:hypothetical protein